MKFGKRLKQQVEETLPEWRDKFLSYKDLKKLVRLISTAPTGLDDARTKAEADLIYLLNVEVDKFNGFFLEQEEDFIIRQKELQERIQELVETVAPTTAQYRAENGRIRRDLVNLHGEMVLLENYSNVNYTGLAKILKKYDKRTGRLLRLPFIEKVLKQPFFITDLISKLIKECEKTMDSVFPVTREEAGEEEKDDEQVAAAAAAAEQSIMRNAVAALATMREMRRGSSTYSHFSLPPLNQPDTDCQQPFQPPSPIPTQ